MQFKLLKKLVGLFGYKIISKDFIKNNRLLDNNEFISLNERVQEGLTQINIGRWNKPFICVYHRSNKFSIDITQYEELANEMNSIAGLVTILNESDGPFYENNNYANGLRTLSINWFHPR